MMVYIRDEKKATVIDFRESAPKDSDKNLFQGDPRNGIKGMWDVLRPFRLIKVSSKNARFTWRKWKAGSIN